METGTSCEMEDCSGEATLMVVVVELDAHLSLWQAVCLEGSRLKVVLEDLALFLPTKDVRPSVARSNSRSELFAGWYSVVVRLDI